MTIGLAALLCHAPIVVPPIGGARASLCQATTRAMRAVADAVVSSQPDVLVLVSPHAPRQPRAFGVCHEPALRGDFARFGHAEERVAVPGAPDAARAVAEACARVDVAVASVGGDELDHGALVPLWFLVEAGHRGPTLLVALPYPDEDLEVRFGRTLATAAAARGERWSIVASGDMSHRLVPGAPAGHHPRAKLFDEAFVAALRRGDLLAATRPDAELRALAGEDVVQSTTVAAAAVGFDAHGLDVRAYEGPFGVGYCEAILHATREARVGDAQLLAIARKAIEHALDGREYRPPTLAGDANAPHATFVTLRRPDGELRGCIGRTEPAFATLAEEVASSAVSAATRDPRFPPVGRDELAELAIEISVLEPPQRITGVSALDPSRYGVVVSSGKRRGVLLPGIEGVDTVEQQLAIVRRKAGIAPDEPITVERFTVRKVHA